MNYVMPPEWAQHEAVWIGFPTFADYWGEELAKAQQQMAAFANAVHDEGNGENVHLITGTKEAAAIAADMVAKDIIVKQAYIGDSWLRDTGCIIVKNGANRRARNFGFNGWGNRYHYPGDKEIGENLAKDFGLAVDDCDWILEGGAIDVDGEGLGVTTEDCLLNPNRNSHLTKADIEMRLERDLGIGRLLWLGDGLANDHTDGHVDNLARFIGPNHLVIPHAYDNNDPNASTFANARNRAEKFGCQVTTIPSVGRYVHNKIEAPASYMNFYIANSSVIIPTYGSQYDDKALAAFEPLFPDRRIIGLPADAILTGGGSFHCCSQQIAF